jgi:hypothetical protein
MCTVEISALPLEESHYTAGIVTLLHPLGEIVTDLGVWKITTFQEGDTLPMRR